MSATEPPFVHRSRNWHRHEQHHRLADGSRVYLRSLEPADLSRANEFFGRLSDTSRYYRFFIPMPRLDSGFVRELARQSQDARCAVVVAYLRHREGDETIGGGRIVGTARRSTCEFSVTIADAWHGRGCGRVILRALIVKARALGYHRIEGQVLASNTRMLALAAAARMRSRTTTGDRDVRTVSRALIPRYSGTRPRVLVGMTATT